MSSQTPSLQLEISGLTGKLGNFDLVTGIYGVGRNTNNAIVLPESLVSDYHAQFRYQDGSWWLVDLDSTNGVFSDSKRISGPLQLRNGLTFDIGSTRFRVSDPVIANTRSPSAGHGQPSPVAGSATLRSDAGLHGWLLASDRYRRWAQEWLHAERAGRLLLRGREFQRARRWQRDATRYEGQQVDLPVAELIAASARARRSAGARTWFFALAGLAVVVVAASVWQQSKKPADQGQNNAETPAETPDKNSRFATDLLELPDEDSGSKPPVPVTRTWITHTVIPGETARDISARYDVPIPTIAEWNALHPDHLDLKTGQQLQIQPRKPAFAPQRIEYEVEVGEDAPAIATRFGIGLDQFRAFNPDLKAIAPGTKVSIWVETKPLESAGGSFTPPEIVVREGAISHGYPQKGTLENSVQIPESPLYSRRNPREMYFASHSLKQLLLAVHTFRGKFKWEGKLVLADSSLIEGGPINPHVSHQSGRDIDIWLPTVRGVYKDSHIGVDRRPNPNEADWFATWNLIESLLSTKEIVYIFISYELQEHLHTAAKIAGYTDEALKDLIQWPNGNSKAIVRHSDGHIHHIHVRFRCGQDSPDCKDL